MTDARDQAAGESGTIVVRDQRGVDRSKRSADAFSPGRNYDRRLERTPGHVAAVTVCDRQADVYGFIRKSLLAEKPILIRATRKAKMAIDRPVYIVHVTEIGPPQATEGVHWLLLTALLVTSLEDAVEEINWYTLRWRMERFHYVLKSGCRTEELQ